MKSENSAIKPKKSLKQINFRNNKILKNWSLYLLMLPTLVYIFIFAYLPMGGLIMSFQNYNPAKGIFGSPFTDMNGFKWFYKFVTLPDFWNIIKNTLVLSLYSIVVNTIMPILFALFCNEIQSKHYKKTVQTITYAPYFISTVVAVGMLFTFSNYDSGIINRILSSLHLGKVSAMESNAAFPHLYVLSGLWQGLGWWSIIYIGTLSNVDKNLHEAAVIDGAGRWTRLWNINFPTILPMAVIMLIMSIGNILSVGFEKVYLMQTQGNLGSSRTISTYIYEMFGSASPSTKYSYTTAIGLFNSLVNIIFLVIANYISRKLSETSLW